MIDLAIIDSRGKTLYNSLLKPIGKITRKAMETHHISEEIVATAPTLLDEWHGKICPILAGKTVVTYNAKFDSQRIKFSLASYNLVTCNACAALTFECAMLGYAEFWNAPARNGYHNAPWQSLSTACYQQGIRLDPTTMHRALADALATLALLRQVAAAGENAARYGGHKDVRA